MERLRKLPVLFLLTLCAVLAMTGTARAAEGYEIGGVDVNRTNGTATVKLTAAGDCNLFAGLYDGDGRFVSFASESVTGAEEEQTKTVTFPSGIAEDTSVSAFLTGTGNAPLCDKAAGYDGNVYAILYDDGMLVLQHGKKLKNGKTVSEMWLKDLEQYYNYNFSHDTADTPWYDSRASILNVEITDHIQPLSTSCWFLNCENLSNINMSGLDTQNVTNMLNMFRGCTRLTNLNLDNFNTSRVT